ncbi:MAG: DNA methyltransferase [Candidatus Thorarchaeota archaeon]
MVVEKTSDDSQVMKQQPLEIIGNIDPSLTLPNNAEILVISRDQSYLTHGIHKFPAKFFPELPRYLILRYSEMGQRVLDPMCGSGTVVLEALLNGRAGIGIDIDPMACLITKVKTTPIDVDTLQIAKESIENEIQSCYEEKNYTPFIPDFNYRDTWFRDFVLQELGIIKQSIDNLEHSRFSKSRPSDVTANTIDFYNVVFSSIIRDVSNADPHCTRTVIRKKQVKHISSGDTINRFKQTLSQQIDSMNELSITLRSNGFESTEVTKGSATSISLRTDSVGLAVTSPPYINAVDYPRTHQLEMYWLGLVEEGPLSKMKRNYIGTETVYKKEYEKLHTSGHDSLDPILEEIYNRDPRRSFITYKFFNDMTDQLRETLRVLKPGSRYCLAIGNNTIRGVRVKSHEILKEIALSENVGFELDRTFYSGLIRHFIRIPREERMQGEWVLIFKKPS